MTWDRHAAPTWQARTLTLLTDVTAALLDLIDLGPHPDTITPRRPSDREIALTTRNGDDYRPTPHSPRATYSEPSDPTGRAIVARETDIQNATRIVEELVTTAGYLTATYRLTPTDSDGDQLDRPWLDGWRPAIDADPILAHPEELGPEHHLPITETATGHLQVNTDPTTCRRHVLAGTRYIAAVIDSLTDRWAHLDDPDARAHLHDDQQRLHHLVLRAHRYLTGIRQDPTEPRPADACPDPYRRGCGRTLNTEDLERNRTACAACRMWHSRRKTTR